MQLLSHSSQPPGLKIIRIHNKREKSSTPNPLQKRPCLATCSGHPPSKRGPFWWPGSLHRAGRQRASVRLSHIPSRGCSKIKTGNCRKAFNSLYLFLFLQKSSCFQKVPFLVPNSSGPFVILVQVIATNRGKGMEILAKFRCYLLSASHSIPIISKHHKLPLLLTKMS